MKKIFTFVFTITMIFSLVACGSNNSNDTTKKSSQQTTNLTQQNGVKSENETSQQEATNPQTESETVSTEEAKTVRTEYVKTYSVYAEQGAEVTWFDSETGRFRYKDKCETCGEIAGGEHSGSLFVDEGSSYNAGFTCKNPDCSMWGKSQQAIIGCSVSGEWVEIDE